MRYGRSWGMLLVMPRACDFVLWFDEIDKDDIALVGGKGANLGEMTKVGFPVPDGFVVTAAAYDEFIGDNHLKTKIHQVLDSLDPSDTVSLERASRQVRKMVSAAPVPEKVAAAVMKTYLKLGKTTKVSDTFFGVSDTLVAVRSSATAEDLPDASFAGQQETFLNVVGESNVINKVREAWASLFTPRAIFYRQEKKFDHFKVKIAVPVQRMVQSESSGVMFTINPVNNDKSVVVVEAIWGLGELIVQGSVTPDHFEILKRDLSIINKQINRQTKMMIRKLNGFETENEILAVAKNKQEKPKISDKTAVEIAELGIKLQQHYFFPQDAEWAVEKGKIYLVQTRPVTTMKIIEGRGKREEGRGKREEGRGENATKGLDLLVKGDPASPGLVSGPAIVIENIKEISKVKPGNVLVMEMTTPDFVPAMKKAVAIVTDQGGQTSHAAIVSRELGVACVVGTQNATKKIKTGTVITVNAVTGEVFRGAIQKTQNTQIAGESESRKVGISESLDIQNLKTATKLYVNLAEPELAEKVAAENVDGVGLLRAEFVMAQIGIHPKKAIAEKKSADYTRQIFEGLRQFARAFYPRPVVYRASDFRTNEYRNLKGGDKFEPVEPNPMLGFRGAYRYMVDEAVFELELLAIRRAREEYDNLDLMIPFVRSVKELTEVKKLVYAAGLRRSSSFHLWMMAELPVNVISIGDFISAGIDGISIGSNDLTMLTLGTDRDNETVAGEFNEMDPAVLWSLQRLITTARDRGITSSICGQAPSIYPDLTEKLVKWGITSISVSPDRIEATRRLIYEAERKIISR
ncbi:MAG: Phosphoenolpyruvate synthase [Candidatus Woesebacteria bacterium GW2011_GWA2_44_33]|uniref:Phosphoenolpyruvate synthase n=1 Tax=Candidatus Woesebacteria bacterium GW2011_GWA2_44_33 TaxID=1618564 RepID=A0A0G1M3W2_9BACT|nr:MAG: Phosphoenolpyruvate synthase [Candidatus Woesebacteria bacterium GW2011_GWA2_44_33]